VSDAQKIPLSELIAELRTELAKAQKEGSGKELRFKVEEIEIELKVGISKDLDAKGKVNFWVYEAELGGSASQEHLQRILLKIKPTDLAGHSTEVSGETSTPGSVSVLDAPHQ